MLKELSERYKRTRCYCPGCDMTFIVPGKKCPICNKKYKCKLIPRRVIKKLSIKVGE